MLTVNCPDPISADAQIYAPCCLAFHTFHFTLLQKTVPPTKSPPVGLVSIGEMSSKVGAWPTSPCLRWAPGGRSGAHLSERLDFTVSGPRRPAQALLQDGDEAGDGLTVGAAAHLPRFCHQGESRCRLLSMFWVWIAALFLCLFISGLKSWAGMKHFALIWKHVGWKKRTQTVNHSDTISERATPYVNSVQPVSIFSLFV